MTKKAVFLDRDGVMNIDYGWISSPHDMHLYPFTAEAVGRLNRAEWLVIVITNQSVIARGDCDSDTVDVIHDKMSADLALCGAKVDAFYICPHHPDYDNGEDCNCRKPETGMIDRAVRDFDIDLPTSYLIGDKTSDILAGKRSGMKTIMVRTGKGGRDGKFNVEADTTVANLEKAVNLILGSDT